MATNFPTKIAINAFLPEIMTGDSLMVGQEEGHPACKKMGGWWRWALVSPDGVAPSWMVGVSASVNLPLHHKVQKFSSGTGSPRWSRKKGCKTVVWWCGVCFGTSASLKVVGSQLTLVIKLAVGCHYSPPVQLLHLLLPSGQQQTGLLQNRVTGVPTT